MLGCGSYDFQLARRRGHWGVEITASKSCVLFIGWFVCSSPLLANMQKKLMFVAQGC
ncbi:hypothetical protein B0H19DRAFT_1128703 [Mycena capillaripes]|nr:hypothetical protein B0H19DRAFT_1128703 [Mycena capillaripes]